MVYFCELNRPSREHAAVNGTILKLIARLFPDDTVSCWVDKRHWLAMAESAVLDEKNIRPAYIRVLTPKRGSKLRWAMKLLRECRQAYHLLLSAKRGRAKLTFFASASPLTVWFVTRLADIWFQDVKLVITLHGELQLLRLKNEKWIDRFYVRCLQSSFARRLKNQRFLLLGEHIQSAVFRYGYLRPSQVIAIPHPLTLQTNKKVVEPVNKVIFGHIGVAKLAKRSQLFFELAKYIHTSKPECAVSFVLAGSMLEELQPWENEWVVRKHSDGFLDTDAYLSMCESMAYAIFCYADEEYELISSGAIMDAIALEIPMIVLRNDYFEKLFSCCAAPPGILCDNIDDLYETVAAIIDKKVVPYSRLKEGIRELKDILSNDKIAETASLLKEFVTL